MLSFIAIYKEGGRKKSSIIIGDSFEQVLAKVRTLYKHNFISLIFDEEKNSSLNSVNSTEKNSSLNSINSTEKNSSLNSVNSTEKIHKGEKNYGNHKKL